MEFAVVLVLGLLGLALIVWLNKDIGGPATPISVDSGRSTGPDMQVALGAYKKAKELMNSGQTEESLNGFVWAREQFEKFDLMNLGDKGPGGQGGNYITYLECLEATDSRSAVKYAQALTDSFIGKSISSLLLFDVLRKVFKLQVLHGNIEKALEASNAFSNICGALVKAHSIRGATGRHMAFLREGLTVAFLAEQIRSGVDAKQYLAFVPENGPEFSYHLDGSRSDKENKFAKTIADLQFAELGIKPFEAPRP